MAMLRVLFDPPASGAWNMAVDEALLEATAATKQATLRFYQWQEPTLSLGYFQSLEDRKKHPASSNCPAVRRSSGGGAILHDRELTYSIAIHESPGILKATQLVDMAHETLIATLAEFGVEAALYRDQRSCTGDAANHAAEPFLCFLRRTCTDIVCGHHKIAGSAQRRRRKAILQHGSILLAQSAAAPELPGIAELADCALQPIELTKRWTPRLAAALRMQPTAGSLFMEESRRAQELAKTQFAVDRRLARR